MTMIIIAGQLSCGYIRKPRSPAKYRKKIVRPMEAICFDSKEHAIYKNLTCELEKCVYTPSFEKKRLSASDTVLEKNPSNPDCKQQNICFAACQKSNCLALSVANTVVHHKAVWTLRFVCFASLYTGCVLGYLLFMVMDRSRRIGALVYKKQIEESYESSEIVSEGEEIAVCVPEQNSQDSFGDKSITELKPQRSRFSLNNQDFEREGRQMSLL